MNITDLILKAKAAREKAYAPYSQFLVGAAILTDSGKIYTGCNIESASFTPTCCAERVAIFKAVSEGEKNFSAIAVVGGKKGDTSFDLCYPCGVCRQVMSEFCGKDMRVILSDSQGNIKEHSFGELLPFSFELK